MSVSFLLLTTAYVRHWRDTKTLWSRTARVNPRNLTAFQRLGAAYQSAGWLDLAEAHLHNAIRANANYASGYRALAVVLFEQKRPAEAEAVVRKTLQLQPNDASTHFIYGSFLSSKGRFDEAEEHLRKAVDLDGTHMQARVNLGNMYCRMGRYDEGIAMYRGTLERFPTAWGAWLNLTQALDDTGRTRDALDTLRKARALAAQQRQDDIVAQIDRYAAALQKSGPSPRP